MTIMNAKAPADIIDVIHAEWPEFDYCKSTANELADEGVATFHAQTETGHDRYFTVNVMTDTITQHGANGIVQDQREF